MRHNQSTLPARPGCFTYGLFAVASVIIIGTVTITHALGWFIDQVLVIQGIAIPLWLWPVIIWGLASVLALLIAPLALFTEAPRFRAAYQTWGLAVLFTIIIAFVRFAPTLQEQFAAVLQIVLTLAAAVMLALVARWRNRTLAIPNSSGVLNALGLVPVLVFPFALFGALGSLLDVWLNLLAGLSLGVFAGVLLDAFLLRRLAVHTSGAGWDIVFGGWAAGVALLILGAGFGFNGTQLILMVTLPMLGFVAVALAHMSQPAPWLAVSLLLGLCAAAPLMFFDPEELTLVLGGSEISQWAVVAAGAAWLSAAITGLVLWASRRFAEAVARPRFALPWIPFTAGFALLLYFFIGQPGFYGERLFVILKDQADVSAAAQIEDRNERVTFVYETLTAHADITQANLRATLNQFGVQHTPYYLVNALEVDGGPLVRLYLATQPEVERVLSSPKLRPLPVPIPTSAGTATAPNRPQWNITSIGADRVWEEFNVTGQGIVIGNSDSGVQGDHPALRDGYRGRNNGDDYNWLDPWNFTTRPTDIGGHGTHTLGSVLGRNNIGVAPGAEWMGCVNLARNLANPALYLDCMQFMLAPYPQNGNPLTDGDPTRAAHVLNNSWGCPPIEGCDATVLQPAVGALRHAGIFVVASAGNEGPLCSSVNDPIAIYDEAFSVGAVDSLGDLADFSSRGPVTVDGSGRPKPDLSAPGVEVLSAYPGGTYEYASGTSMAGPHVVGVVALMWSANPKLIGAIENTEQILRETARPFIGSASSSCGASNTAGAGLVDAYAAVQAALAEP
ncbi:MAG: S8 family serine peptidase [Anaerolineales bacterium]|nr:S8 family serine peptidase [Anaerolineales bacterium]